MTPSELTKQLQARHEEQAALKQLWASLLANCVPEEKQFLVWLSLHNFDRMVSAIQRTAAKSLKLGGAMDTDHAVRFCSKVANTKKSEEERLVVAA
jgi:hypothetical protein